MIRLAKPTEREVLFDIWLRSVRATHTFVAPDDIVAMAPDVRAYLASTETEFWVSCTESDAITGFMGLHGSQLESLFIDPAYFRRGVGARLVRHARTQRDDLAVDVNEQNEEACAFYRAQGFVIEGRSELDDQGRPYPLLHMRSSAGP